LPVGQNQFDVAHVASLEASKQARKSFALKNEFLSLFQRDSTRPDLPQKIFRFVFSPNGVFP
jgi:hypothetical protein